MTNLPLAPGQPWETEANTGYSSPPSLSLIHIFAPYNDLEALERILSAHEGRVAAVIVEPVAGNMGVVPPAPG